MQMKPFKCFFVVFASLAFQITANAQSNKVKIDSSRVRHQASVMAKSFISADYKVFIKYAYPQLVKLMGGEENMIDILAGGVREMQKQGFSFKEVSIQMSTDSAYKAGPELHTLVMQSITMNAAGGTLRTDSYLLAISSDGGKNWTFLDTQGLQDPKRLKMVFLAFNDELIIPEKKEPVFTKQ
jgi:hypothetical protein